MGKQYDKIIKRRRRLSYLERKKQKAKEAAVAAAKPRVRKPAPRKAPTPKAVESLAAVEPLLAAEPAPAEVESAPAE